MFAGGDCFSSANIAKCYFCQNIKIRGCFSFWFYYREQVFTRWDMLAFTIIEYLSTIKYKNKHSTKTVQQQYKKSKDVSLWLNYLIDNRTSITAFLEVQISWRKRGERTSCTTHHYFHSLNNTDSVTVWLPLRDKLNTQSPVKVELSINSANKCLAPFQVNVPFLCYTFYTWKHEETFSFLVFSRVTERDLWLTT